MQVDSTSVEVIPDSLRKRIFLCYILFTQFPETGLDELMGTMAEIAEFYVSKDNYVPRAVPELREKQIRTENADH